MPRSKRYTRNLGRKKADHIEIDDERFCFRAEAIEYVGRARRLADLVTRAGYSMVERWTRIVPGGDRQQLAILSVGD